jgi:hypothetical protein
MPVHTCAHELLGRARSRAVRRNDGADDRRQLENDYLVSGGLRTQTRMPTSRIPLACAARFLESLSTTIGSLKGCFGHTPISGAAGPSVTDLPD